MAPMPKPTIKVLRPGHTRELDQLIDLYREAIEPSEQKTVGEIQTMVSDPRYVLIVTEMGGAVTGFAISMFPPAADFFLLEYMAVAPAQRGQRIGELLFEEAYRYGSTRGPSTMLLEVDQPIASTSQNTGQNTGQNSGQNTVSPTNHTEARVRFYRRLGCRKVAGLDYILPLETVGAPPPMMLLTYEVPAVMAVSRERLRHWLETTYVRVYGKTPTDPRIASMMAQPGDAFPALPL